MSKKVDKTGMCFRFSILILATWLSLATNAFAANRMDCWKNYAQLGANAARALPGIIKEQSKQYWQEVKASPYYSRIFIAPRHEPEKSKFFWELITMGDPLSELSAYSSRPLRKKLAFGATAPLWGYGLYKLDKKLEKKNIDDLVALENSNIGAGYLLQMASLGFVEQLDLDGLLETHTKNLNKWLTAKNSGETKLDRFKSLRAAGLLANDMEAKELDRLAAEVFTEINKKVKMDPSLDRFALLRMAFAEAILKNPVFAKKSDLDKQLLFFIYLPEVKISTAAGKYADIELIKKLYQKEANGPEEIQLLRILDNPGEPWLKNKRAQGAFLPRQKQYLTDQVDRILLPMEIISLGKKTRLQNELDYWKLLMDDPRFAYIKDPWLQNEIDDDKALTALQLKVNGIKEIELLAAKNTKLDVQTACSLLGQQSEKERSNHSFAKVSQLLTQIDSQHQTLSLEQRQACGMQVAEEYWRYYLLEAYAKDPTAHAELTKKSLERVSQIVSCSQLTGNEKRLVCPLSR